MKLTPCDVTSCPKLSTFKAQGVLDTTISVVFLIYLIFFIVMGIGFRPFTRDIFAHNIAIKRKKNIFEPWISMTNQGNL